MTLNDLERRDSPYFAFFSQNSVALLANYVTMVESIGTHAFSVARPTVWNSLPDYLRDPAVDSEQFRRWLEDVSVRWTLEAIAH